MLPLLVKALQAIGDPAGTEVMVLPRNPSHPGCGISV
jgi:hypothetical protein